MLRKKLLIVFLLICNICQIFGSHYERFSGTDAYKPYDDANLSSEAGVECDHNQDKKIQDKDSIHQNNYSDDSTDQILSSGGRQNQDEYYDTTLSDNSEINNLETPLDNYHTNDNLNQISPSQSRIYSDNFLGAQSRPIETTKNLYSVSPRLFNTKLGSTVFNSTIRDKALGVSNTIRDKALQVSNTILDKAIEVSNTMPQIPSIDMTLEAGKRKKRVNSNYKQNILKPGTNMLRLPDESYLSSDSTTQNDTNPSDQDGTNGNLNQKRTTISSSQYQMDSNDFSGALSRPIGTRKSSYVLSPNDKLNNSNNLIDTHLSSLSDDESAIENQVTSISMEKSGPQFQADINGNGFLNTIPEKPFGVSNTTRNKALRVSNTIRLNPNIGLSLGGGIKKKGVNSNYRKKILKLGTNMLRLPDGSYLPSDLTTQNDANPSDQDGTNGNLNQMWTTISSSASQMNSNDLPGAQSRPIGTRKSSYVLSPNDKLNNSNNLIDTHLSSLSDDESAIENQVTSISMEKSGPQFQADINGNGFLNTIPEKPFGVSNTIRDKALKVSNTIRLNPNIGLSLGGGINKKGVNSNYRKKILKLGTNMLRLPDGSYLPSDLTTQNDANPSDQDDTNGNLNQLWTTISSSASQMNSNDLPGAQIRPIGPKKSSYVLSPNDKLNNTNNLIDTHLSSLSGDESVIENQVAPISMQKSELQFEADINDNGFLNTIPEKPLGVSNTTRDKALRVSNTIRLNPNIGLSLGGGIKKKGVNSNYRKKILKLGTNMLRLPDGSYLPSDLTTQNDANLPDQDDTNGNLNEMWPAISSSQYQMNPNDFPGAQIRPIGPKKSSYVLSPNDKLDNTNNLIDMQPSSLSDDESVIENQVAPISMQKSELQFQADINDNGFLNTIPEKPLGVSNTTRDKALRVSNTIRLNPNIGLSLGGGIKKKGVNSNYRKKILKLGTNMLRLPDGSYLPSDLTTQNDANPSDQDGTNGNLNQMWTTISSSASQMNSNDYPGAQIRPIGPKKSSYVLSPNDKLDNTNNLIDMQPSSLSDDESVIENQVAPISMQKSELQFEADINDNGFLNTIPEKPLGVSNTTRDKALRVSNTIRLNPNISLSLGGGIKKKGVNSNYRKKILKPGTNMLTLPDGSYLPSDLTTQNDANLPDQDDTNGNLNEMWPAISSSQYQMNPNDFPGAQIRPIGLKKSSYVLSPNDKLNNSNNLIDTHLSSLSGDESVIENQVAPISMQKSEVQFQADINGNGFLNTIPEKPFGVFNTTRDKALGIFDTIPQNPNIGLSLEGGVKKKLVESNYRKYILKPGTNTLRLPDGSYLPSDLTTQNDANLPDQDDTNGNLNEMWPAISSSQYQMNSNDFPGAQIRPIGPTKSSYVLSPNDKLNNSNNLIDMHLSSLSDDESVIGNQVTPISVKKSRPHFLANLNSKGFPNTIPQNPNIDLSLEEGIEKNPVNSNYRNNILKPGTNVLNLSENPYLPSALTTQVSPLSMKMNNQRKMANFNTKDFYNIIPENSDEVIENVDKLSDQNSLSSNNDNFPTPSDTCSSPQLLPDEQKLLQTFKLIKSNWIKQIKGVSSKSLKDYSLQNYPLLLEKLRGGGYSDLQSISNLEMRRNHLAKMIYDKFDINALSFSEKIQLMTVLSYILGVDFNDAEVLQDFDINYKSRNDKDFF